MRLPASIILGLAALLGLTTLLLPPAGAAATPSTLALEAPPTAVAHGPLTLTVRLQSGTAPLADRPVVLQRLDAELWTDLATATTSATGEAAVTVRFDEATTYRALFRGDTTAGQTNSAAVTVLATRRPISLTVAGPWTVVDETRRTLVARLRSDIGEPIGGATLRVYLKAPGLRWTLARTLRTDPTGTAPFTLAPRTDVRVQVNTSAGSWWGSGTSLARTLDNLPPAPPVSYPRTAPRPRALPAQPRATGAGARPVIQRIPDSVWRAMRGRSWHPGCPVGRGDLRLIRINYWDFTGYRRRGELVVRADVAGRMVGALTDMYRGRYPIRRMYRVDRFGWSHVQQGADDRASMAADNTSAFNCRYVTGRPGVRSPHSYGRAIDINPWENPFVSRAGVLPNRWWLYRSHPRVAWRSAAHPVAQIWRRHGFRWSYPHSDPQHWDGRMSFRAGAPARH